MNPDPKVAGILAAHEHVLVILLAHQLKDLNDDQLRRAIDGLTGIVPAEDKVDPARKTEFLTLVRFVTTETLERIGDRVVTEVRRLQQDGR